MNKSYSLILILSILLVALFSILGTLLPIPLSFKTTIEIGAWSLWFIWAGLDALLVHKTKKHFFQLKEQEKFDLFLHQKEESLQDVSHSKRKFFHKMYKSLFACLIYALLLIVLCTFHTKETLPLTTCASILLLYIALLPLSCLFEKKHEEEIGLLNRNDFPILFSLVDWAFTQTKLNKPYRLYLELDANLGAAKTNKGYSIVIGALLLQLLNEEELKQGLLHECAHLQDKDHALLQNRLANFLTQRSDFVEGKLPLSPLFPLQNIYVTYSIEQSLYRLTSSQAREIEADHLNAQMGDAAIATQALAKINLFDFYQYENLYPSLYKEEEPPKDAVSGIYASFCQAFADKKDFYKKLLLSGITGNSDSHPSFAQRRHNMGDHDFSLEFLPKEEAYQKETLALLQKADALLYTDTQEYFKEARTAYLEAMQDIENQKIEDLTPEETESYLEKCAVYGDRKLLEEKCDWVLAKETNPFATARAHYYKGVCLLHRFDRSGIAQIYTAIELNHNYTENGFEEIGNFCVMMGLQEDLMEYRRRFHSSIQEHVDQHDKAGELTKKDQYIPENLPENRLEEILSFIKATAGDALLQVYLVRKVITNDYFSSVFTIRLNPNTAEEKIDEIMNAIFYHLDVRKENWQYSLFFDNVLDPAILKKLHRVPNACVYDAEMASSKE